MIAFQLVLSCLVATSVYSTQFTYSRIIPYDPRYLIRRAPVRRSAEIDPRIRLPITRYFPQVDTQVAPAPYMAQAEQVVPAAYRLANGEVYAVPSKWSEETIPISQLERNDENDYGSYDYENDFSPVYANQNALYAIPQETEVQDNDGDLYNDLMVNYFLGELQPAMEETEYAEVQRRSQPAPAQLVQNVQEAGNSKKQNDNKTVQEESSTPAAVTETSSAVPPPSSSPVAVSPSNVASPPSPSPARVSNVLPMMHRYPYYGMTRRATSQNGLWSEFESADRGQKEYPIYRQISRPSKKSPMATLEEQMSRTKGSGVSHKDAFPLIEKLLAANKAKDPLTEQLDNLKYPNM